ncbi:hypothetical protein HN51_002087 [Arachis hypogaea]|uniref:Transmembrane protein n=1 Tax=Arachis hypogaea TaxID=3818 RepID=A0A445ENU6_ARAHY|nr:uncharacterized protein LOC112697356 [Arachis hypogaea]RYR77128.1 hypothetical protein Ahy_A01g001595 [Arachis hypogaea]
MGGNLNFQSDHTMSSSIFLLYCLLIFSLLLSQHTSYSQDVMPTRKLGISGIAQDHMHHEIQAADEAMESNPAKEDSMEVILTSNGYVPPRDLVYHTDYHGVTTHPTPKHPTP